MGREAGTVVLSFKLSALKSGLQRRHVELLPRKDAVDVAQAIAQANLLGHAHLLRGAEVYALCTGLVAHHANQGVATFHRTHVGVGWGVIVLNLAQRLGELICGVGFWKITRLDGHLSDERRRRWCRWLFVIDFHGVLRCVLLKGTLCI